MIRQRIFEYAILFHPEERKDKDGNAIPDKTKLLLDVARVLAKDEKEVAMRAAREIPEEYLERLELVEVVVRPF